jgi:hypothetical protein
MRKRREIWRRGVVASKEQSRLMMMMMIGVWPDACNM